MNLPTLVVCDSTAEKRKEIEDLVQSQSALTYLETVSSEDAGPKMDDESTKVVWLELDPEPEKAIALLTDWKSKHTAMYFLVSYQTLKADLVKASMHSGAFDFLDAGTWSDQLPDVVTRLLAKEKAASVPPPKVERRFDDTADRIPAYSGSINKMRHVEEDLLSRTGGEVVPMPAWVVPAIALAVVALGAALYFTHSH